MTCLTMSAPNASPRIEARHEGSPRNQTVLPS